MSHLILTSRVGQSIVHRPGDVYRKRGSPADVTPIYFSAMHFRRNVLLMPSSFVLRTSIYSRSRGHSLECTIFLST